jgi:hypothetical protein
MKAHTFPDTRILNIHGTKSHCRVFVCVATGVVSKYFLFLCLLNAVFQLTQVNNASRKSLISVWLNVAIPKISSMLLFPDNLSGRNVQHSLNMSIASLMILSHISLCIIGFLEMTSIIVMASRIDWWISAYFFMGLKVVVYLPSKDIAGNDVTSCIVLSWMNILRHECVRKFG